MYVDLSTCSAGQHFTDPVALIHDSGIGEALDSGVVSIQRRQISRNGEIEICLNPQGVECVLHEFFTINQVSGKCESKFPPLYYSQRNPRLQLAINILELRILERDGIDRPLQRVGLHFVTDFPGDFQQFFHQAPPMTTLLISMCGPPIQERMFSCPLPHPPVSRSTRSSPTAVMFCMVL
ncbi:MAG: hypothetical protein DDT27_01370 [Dehalococcoidia bacterium]|nr:hypothetical protein [Chloroflexota bacterium]MBT9162806.1 hypothetical protein [Chloroflexota bacterium]